MIPQTKCTIRNNIKPNKIDLMNLLFIPNTQIAPRFDWIMIQRVKEKESFYDGNQ